MQTIPLSPSFFKEGSPIVMHEAQTVGCGVGVGVGFGAGVGEDTLLLLP